MTAVAQGIAPGLGDGGPIAAESPKRDANRRLRILAEIIGPLTRSLGPNYEIVLHDYRLPDRSVVAVAGKITERRVGSAIGLSVVGEGDRAQDRLNYLAKGTNGRIVNCSTIVLRDDNHKVFGALCISLDVTAIRHAAAVLHTLSGQHAEPKPTTFSNDIRDVIDVALREVLAGRAAALLSRDERLEVFRALEPQHLQREAGDEPGGCGVGRVARHGVCVFADGAIDPLRPSRRGARRRSGCE